MNSVQAAAAEVFVEILRDAGVPVTIGGKDYQAMISPSGLAVDLEEGVFTEDGTLTTADCRFSFVQLQVYRRPNESFVIRRLDVAAFLTAAREINKTL